eukprot:3447840-Pyramimonas_sp.AAC.1
MMHHICRAWSNPIFTYNRERTSVVPMMTEGLVGARGGRLDGAPRDLRAPKSTGHVHLGRRRRNPKT